MKVVQAHTGATAVPVPDRNVILIDPKIGHDTAINAIRAVLPEADPGAVQGWVADVTPTVLLPRVALQHRTEQPAVQANVRPGRHRRNERPRPLGRLARRAVGAKVNAMALMSVVLVVFFGVGAVRNPPDLPSPREMAYAERAGRPAPMPQPTRTESEPTRQPPRPAATVTKTVTVKPTPTESPWKEPAFTTVALGGRWTCNATEPEVNECVSPDGIPVRVEAWAGPTGRTFVFQYADPATSRKHRAELKVFKTEADAQTWASHHGALQRNLVMGKRWALYGTNAWRIAKYGKILKQMDK